MPESMHKKSRRASRRVSRNKFSSALRGGVEDMKQRAGAIARREMKRKQGEK